MLQSIGSWSPAHASSLEYGWGEYRVWAATAREQRSAMFSWRFRVLILSIAGAVFGTLSHQLTDAGFAAAGLFSLSTMFGLLSGVSIALAAFFSKEILSPERERRWVRARSVAEALKSETYLFRTGAPPYDTPDAAGRLVQRVQELEETVHDLHAVTLSSDQRRERLPAEFLTVHQYVNERVDDQIDKFYRPRVKQYEAVVTRGRRMSLVLGALAAILGALGASGWTAAWVAVLTTITASIAAYLYAGRYQYLIVSYQATARRLEALKQLWLVSPASDTDTKQCHQFIRACEEAISIENTAWMAKWLEAAPGTAPENA